MAKTGGCAPFPSTGTAARRYRPRSRPGRRLENRLPGRQRGGSVASAPAAARSSMTRSPAITDRIPRASSATSASFTRKPGRADLHRPTEEAGAANVVRMTARHSGSGGGQGPAASMPSPPGISMSSRATSGRCPGRRRRLVAAADLGTTSRSSSSSRRARKAPRTSAWSSAMSTRITGGHRFRFHSGRGQRQPDQRRAGIPLPADGPRRPGHRALAPLGKTGPPRRTAVPRRPRFHHR